MFDPENIFQFKFVKENSTVYFERSILKNEKREYDYLRLLIRLSFPKLKFDPQIAVNPTKQSCSICQIDELVPTLASGKLNSELKWVCLEDTCKETHSNNTLELCDIHFMTKYENDVHTLTHKMAMIRKNKEPLFYFYSQSAFLQKYQNKTCAICNEKLGLKRWH